MDDPIEAEAQRLARLYQTPGWDDYATAYIKELDATSLFAGIAARTRAIIKEQRQHAKPHDSPAVA